MTDKKIFNKLPEYLQTNSQRKFFDSTFEQAFSKKDSEKLNGYIGRRLSGSFDPDNDYYIPEYNKDRTWYQLEPTVFSRMANGEKTNIKFYQDMVNYIEYTGGITGNHNKLFESEYYSYAPPIDMDKFVNYQNYYWLEEPVNPIVIEDVDDIFINSYIVDNAYFKASNHGVFIGTDLEGLEFTTGLRVTFPDSTDYDIPLTVYGVGDSIFLKSDEEILFPVETPRENDADYITIDRTSRDNNLWSRSNRWYHIVAIEQTLLYTGQVFPASSIRAVRPIIEFVPNIELYNSGNEFYSYANAISFEYNFSDIDGNTLSNVSSLFPDTTIQGGLFLIPNDTTNEQGAQVNLNIWEASVSGSNVSLTLYSQAPADIGNIVIVNDGNYDNQLGRTYYLNDNNEWKESDNIKTGPNQEPRFSLYDLDRNELSNQSVYPESNFQGSEIFSYKVDDDNIYPFDPVLRKRLVYKNLFQGSDIIFENDLTSERYTFIENSEVSDISGYYFYRLWNGEEWTYSNNWRMSDDTSEQKVVDKFNVLDEDDNIFELSVLSNEDDVEVLVSGVESNDFDIENYNGKTWVRINSPQVEPGDDIDVRSFTEDNLPEDSLGYFEIPKALESNPKNHEVIEYSYGDLTPHFVTIIENQDEVTVRSSDRNNQYRDSKKVLNKGNIITQPLYPIVKAMSVSNDDFINLIDSTKFSQNEYKNFKRKFLKFAGSQNPWVNLVSNNSLSHDLLSNVLDITATSKEFTNAFSNSFMVPRGDASIEEFLTVSSSEVTFTSPDDYNNQENILLVYKVDDLVMGEFQSEFLLLEGVDYITEYTNGATRIEFISSKVADNDTVACRGYVSPSPAYIPATPSKLGIHEVYKPSVVIDETYVSPTLIIVGHDGSRNICYGDYSQQEIDILNGDVIASKDDIFKFVDMRDYLLLELEKEIFNNINSDFKNKKPLLTLGDIKPNPLNEKSYTLKEINDVLMPHFSKWASEEKVDFFSNDFYDINDWKTYNYSDVNVVSWDIASQQYTLKEEKMPGHWRGIFEYYFLTTTPEKTPWQMLGFNQKPEWWDTTTDTGDGFTGYGTDYSESNFSMWYDIEQGIIRRGERAGVDSLYSRPGLTGPSGINLIDPINSGSLRSPVTTPVPPTNLIPVDSTGEIKSIVDLFGLNLSNISSKDAKWKFGDYAPVEYAWRTSSEYIFDLGILLYTLRPGEYTEVFWDTENYTIVGDQVIDKSTGFRPNFEDSYVHNEELPDGSVAIKLGLQSIISNYLSYNNQNITERFGDVIRNLNVNLGHKLGGFTNFETLDLFLENSTNSSQDLSNLMVPKENIDVLFYKGSPIEKYDYSGVVIRIEEDNKFGVYGYNLNNMAFHYYAPDKSKGSKKVTKGGTPESFREFEFGERYIEGSLVRYNGKFYRAKRTVEANSFISSDWFTLPRLPEVGGVTAEYYPKRTDEVLTLPYTTKFSNINEVYDFLVGYGEYLKDNGWIYDSIDNFGKPENWVTAADNFLFWISSGWSPGNTFVMSPTSTEMKLNVKNGYPDNVERINNGVYSILDKSGLPINPRDTIINRDGKNISVTPVNEGESIYSLVVTSSESEHIILIDNETSFDDLVYDPVLNSRQRRLKIRGARSNNWFGKVEAPGYFVSGNTMIQNFDNIVESIGNLYESEGRLDNQEMDMAAKHLIGYEARGYLDALDISDNVQYNFYQGFIKNKGTGNAIDKILRSNNIQDKDEIRYYEEWALKVGEFGATDQNITFDIESNYTDVKNNPQGYRLFSSPNRKGSLGEIKIYSAETIYDQPPQIVIEAPETTNGSQASAVAILNNQRKIQEVQIIDSGSGYETAPEVSIIPNGNITEINNQSDLLIAIVDKTEEPVESEISSIINYNINDRDKWLYSSRKENISETIPTTTKSDALPNAGYVSFDDVDYSIFKDIELLWEKENSPTTGDLIWNARNKKNTWCVLKVDDGINVNVVNDSLDIDFSQFTSISTRVLMNLLPYATFERDNTDLNIKESTVVLEVINQSEVVVNDIVNVKIKDDGNYTIIYRDEEVPFGDIADQYDTVKIKLLVNRRYRSLMDSQLDPTLDPNELYWVDDSNGEWEVFKDGDTWRKFEPRVDSTLYENISIREKESGNHLTTIVPYDPAKGLLIGSVEKAVEYKTDRDPARYNNSQDTGLINLDEMFGKDNIGEMWWDVNSSPFIYYEMSKSPNDSDEYIIEYRMDNWGKVFPGSDIKVYEWVESSDTPDQYTGNGTPKNESDYVEERYYNSSLNSFEVKYYFWVEGKTEKAKGKTQSTIDVRNTIQSTRRQNASWFSPVHYNGESQTVCIANSDRILSSRIAIIQINYKSSNTPNQVHTQWGLLREGDKFSKVPEFFWNKMVDSLIGITDLLPKGEFQNGIPVDDNNVVLEVPDSSLSDQEKYGIGIRPQQSMFVDSIEARKIITSKVNDLVTNIQFWDSRFSDWDEGLSSYFWDYVDWYAEGYDNKTTRTKRQVEDMNELLNLDDVSVGDLIRVYPSSPDISIDRYEVYEYEGNDNFKLIRREKGTILLGSGYYDSENSGSAKNELRELLNRIRERIFVGELETNLNLLFFAGLNYAVSEQKEIDWVYKTSYISFVQTGARLRNDITVFQSDSLNEFLEYVNEAKPYHTKIRDVITELEGPLDLANGTVIDNHSMVIKVSFERFGGSYLMVHDQPSEGRWDVDPWDSELWSEISTTKYMGSVDSEFDDDTDTILNSYGQDDELVSISPNESLVFDLIEDRVVLPNSDHWDTLWSWDSQPWDESTDFDNYDTVKYRIHCSSYYGNQFGNFYTIPSIEYATLQNDISMDDDVITVIVDSIDYIQTGGYNQIWINQEMMYFEYSEDNGDGTFTLSGVSRAQNGTGKQDHSVGDKVWDPSYNIDEEYALFMKDGIEGANKQIDISTSNQKQYVNTLITKVNNDGVPVDSNDDPISVGDTRTTENKPVPITNPWYNFIDLAEQPYNQSPAPGEEHRMLVTSKAGLYTWNQRQR